MRFLYILCLILTFFSCTSVPKEYLTSDTTCKYHDSILKINDSELKLDINILNKLKDRKGNLTLIDDESYKREYYNLSKEKIINYNINKKDELAKWLIYRKNGDLISSEFIYKNGSTKIGEETHYNDQGEVTKVIDHEKGYNICWAEAIEIIKKIAKREIKKHEVTGFNLQRANLIDFPDAKPMWRISFDGNEEYELKDITVYWIDGITGEFLKTTKITGEYN